MTGMHHIGSMMEMDNTMKSMNSTNRSNKPMDFGNATVKPQNQLNSFGFARPPTSGSGIGGIIGEEQDLRKTRQAMASSPLKQDYSLGSRFLNNNKVDDPKGFYPTINTNNESMKSL